MDNNLRETILFVEKMNSKRQLNKGETVGHVQIRVGRLT